MGENSFKAYKIMGREDWYRNTTWTKDVRNAFFKRLGRSRSSFHKAQYVRIQAHYLEETGERKNVNAALALLDLMIEKWPEPVELAAAHLQRARCYERLHKWKCAINSHRDSIKAEHEYETAQVGAALHFGWLVVRRCMSKYYDEVLSVLDTGEEMLLFPINQFKYASIFSIILHHKGEKDGARRFANMALEANGKKESPFRYHKKLGLVANPPKAIMKKLIRIAGI